MKELTLSDLESLLRRMDLPEIQYLGDGLYRIMPEGIICGEKFLKAFHNEIQKSIKS